MHNLVKGKLLLMYLAWTLAQAGYVCVLKVESDSSRNVLIMILRLFPTAGHNLQVESPKKKELYPRFYRKQNSFH